MIDGRAMVDQLKACRPLKLITAECVQGLGQLQNIDLRPQQKLWRHLYVCVYYE